MSSPSTVCILYFNLHIPTAATFIEAGLQVKKTFTFAVGPICISMSIGLFARFAYDSYLYTTNCSYNVSKLYSERHVRMRNIQRKNKPFTRNLFRQRRAKYRQAELCFHFKAL